MSKKRARHRSASPSVLPSPRVAVHDGFFRRIPQFAQFCAGALLLCFSGLAAYFNSLQNGWVWDDVHLIATNPDLRPEAPLSRAFSRDVWLFRHPGAGGHNNYFRPMQTLAYRLTAALFGLDPRMFHAVSLAFHLLVTVLAFALFWRVGGRMVGAFAGAALFAVHPIHTEAVDWCSALPDLGCAAFFVLAFLLFHEAGMTSSGDVPPTRSRTWRIFCFVLSCLAFSAALLWKEMAVVFPLVILAWILLLGEFSGLRARLLGAARLSAPYWGILAAYLLLRFRVLGYLTTRQREWNLTPLSFSLSVLDLLRQYWWKLLVPFPLNAYYVFVPVERLADPRALAAVLFALAAGVGIWFAAPRAPLIAFSALWVFLTLVPVLDLYGVGHNVFTERYLYLPSLGFCPLVVLLAARGAGWPPPSIRKPTVITCLLAVLVFFTAITARRNPEWKDDATLFSRTLQVSPRAPFVHFMVASLQSNSASGEAAAERHYLQAISLAERESPPDYLDMVLSYEGLAPIYANGGRFDRAMEALDHVRKIDPNDPEADSEEGVLLEQAGRWSEAAAYLKKAQQRDPEDPNLLNALGLLAWQYDHQLDQAAAYFLKAIAIHSVADDFSASLHNNLGAVYGGMGKIPEAIREFQTAVATAPSDPEFRTHLAQALVLVGRVQEARSELLVALAGAPGYAPARDALHELIAR